MSKYFNPDFTGRADRGEYIGTVLLNALVTACGIFVLTLLLAYLGLASFIEMSQTIYYITFLVMVVAVTARRVRDIGAPIWLCLSPLLPYVGILFIIVFACLKGEDHDEEE